MEEITVQKLKEKIDAGDDLFVLDVREPFEQYQSKLDYDNSTLIPVGELAGRIEEIASRKEQEIVCLCRSGARSAKACNYLEKEGFEDVKNLKGGINEWAREIDDSLPVY